jgi:excisionase family DNA binding protein
MAIDSRSWGPPVACPAHLPHGAVGLGRLLHHHTGHAARGTHRPRGRRDPAVGRNQLYQAVTRGELGAVRIGRSIRIPKHALLDLLAAAGPPTASGDE